MRIFIYLILFILTSQFNISCKEKTKNKTPLDLLHDEIIKVHDEVMPLITDMHKNEMALKEFLNTESNISDSFQNRIKTSIANLANTSEAMMEWMHQFSNPPDGEEAKSKKYLDLQKIKILKVSMGMNMAYQKSTILLNDLKQIQVQ